MTDREHVDALDAELDRRTEAEGRIATALVELESHPGHQLLSAITPTGQTANRWSTARATLSTLWQDFGRFRATLVEARDVRARRSRPDSDDIAQLDTLLLERSIEVSRAPVALPDRLRTGATEHVEHASLEEISSRIDTAFDEVSTLVVEVDTAYQAFCAKLTPLRERLDAAHKLAGDLGLATDDPLAQDVARQTTRADELGQDAATDPLGLDEKTSRDLLGGLDSAVARLERRLAAVGALRDGWNEQLATVTAEVNQLADLATREQQARMYAQQRFTEAPTAVPPDRIPALRTQLAELENIPGWSQRVAALDELRTALRTAEDELRAAYDLAAGLTERRAELRGRHEAYRAKSVRLGHAERPEVLELEQRLQQLLWSSPCDLAAATRALASYQQLVTQPRRSA